MVNVMPAHIMHRAITLCLRRMLPVSRQLTIGGPSRGCVTIQCSRRGLLFAKKPAASMRLIVPGIPGRITPIIPTTRNTQPRIK